MKSFTSYLQSRMLVTFTAVILFILISYQNTQAFVQWDAPSGSTTCFRWQNGGSNNGLFGSPEPAFIEDNKFVFFPTDFAADSINNPYVSDTLVFELLANPGYTITEIRINGEYGAYAVLDGVVDISGQLCAQTLQGADIAPPTPLIVDPAMPISDLPFGEWYASAIITGLNLTEVKIVFTNNLSATGSQSSVSLIDKKEIPIFIQIIPEPATIGLLALGSLVFFGKKK